MLHWGEAAVCMQAPPLCCAVGPTAICKRHVVHCRLPGSNIVLVDMPGLGGIEHECKIARHYITASKSEFVLAGLPT